MSRTTRGKLRTLRQTPRSINRHESGDQGAAAQHITWVPQFATFSALPCVGGLDTQYRFVHRKDSNATGLLSINAPALRAPGLALGVRFMYALIALPRERISFCYMLQAE